MDLNSKISLTEGEKEIQLPLINLLRLTAYYFDTLKREYDVELAKKDAQDFERNRQVLDDFWTWIALKLGLKREDGEKVHLLL